MKGKAMAQKQRVYLDHAATTPVDPRVYEAMRPYFSEEFGNPGGIYQEGQCAKTAVEKARQEVASVLQAHPDEIIFTSGGTEANNLAILGYVRRLEEDGIQVPDMHFVTSVIEHPSVLQCFKALAREGAKVTYVGVTKEGILDMKAFRAALKWNTVLVSVILANNEIGIVQPIEKIVKTVRNFVLKFNMKVPVGRKFFGREKPVVHTDASQAPLYVPFHRESLGADMLTLDAQKMRGPKSVGALYVARGTRLSPVLFGGGQERGLRPGTENVPGIVGFAKALTLAQEECQKTAGTLAMLRGYLLERFKKEIPDAEINGISGGTGTLPNIVNLSLPHTRMDREWIIIQLDARGIAVGGRSACATHHKGDDSSYVVKALGKSPAHAETSLRISMGPDTTKEDVDHFVKALKEILGN